MKAYCEEVSADMGLNGEITDAVMDEADRRLKAEEAERAEALLGAIAKRRGCEVADLRCEDLYDTCGHCGELHDVCKECGGQVECDDPIMLCLGCNDAQPYETCEAAAVQLAG